MEHNRADSQAGGNRDDRGHTMNNVRLRIRLPAVHKTQSRPSYNRDESLNTLRKRPYTRRHEGAGPEYVLQNSALLTGSLCACLPSAGVLACRFDIGIGDDTVGCKALKQSS